MAVTDRRGAGRPTVVVGVVERGTAPRSVSAAIRAGAPAATVLTGRGMDATPRVGPSGLVIRPEKEIILTVVDSQIAADVVRSMAAVSASAEGGNFLAQVRVAEVVGLLQAASATDAGERAGPEGAPMSGTTPGSEGAPGASSQTNIVVAIVQRGKADKPVRAALRAGAQNAVVLFGRGLGIRERLGLLGLAVQPEKEIVLLTVAARLSDLVIRAMVRAGNLDQPGVGFLFVLPVEAQVGIPSADPVEQG